MVGSIQKLVKQDYSKAYDTDEILKIADNLEHQARVVLIFGKDGKYKGIISKKHLLRSFPFNSKTKISTLLSIKNRVSIHAELDEVAKMMLESELKQLPVFDGEMFTGVIDIKDVIDKLSKKIKDQLLEKFMTSPVLYLDAYDQLGTAIETFKKKWISRMPVVDGGKVIGIVSLTDALLEILLRGPTALHMPVRELMQTNLVAIKKSDNIFDAIKLLLTKNVSSVLVLEDGAPYGILTEKDILEHIVASKKMKGEVYAIQAVGELDKLSSSEKESLNNTVVSFMERYANKFAEAYIHLYIKEVSEKFREKKKFSIRINLTTDKGRFYSTNQEFGVEQALHLALGQIEVQIEKKFGRLMRTKTMRNKQIKRIF